MYPRLLRLPPKIFQVPSNLCTPTYLMPTKRTPFREQLLLSCKEKNGWVTKAVPSTMHNIRVDPYSSDTKPQCCCCDAQAAKWFGETASIRTKAETETLDKHSKNASSRKRTRRIKQAPVHASTNNRVIYDVKCTIMPERFLSTRHHTTTLLSSAAKST